MTKERSIPQNKILHHPQLFVNGWRGILLLVQKTIPAVKFHVQSAKAAPLTARKKGCTDIHAVPAQRNEALQCKNSRAHLGKRLLLYSFFAKRKVICPLFRERIRFCLF